MRRRGDEEIRGAKSKCCALSARDARWPAYAAGAQMALARSVVQNQIAERLDCFHLRLQLRCRCDPIRITCPPEPSPPISATMARIENGMYKFAFDNAEVLQIFRSIDRKWDEYEQWANQSLYDISQLAGAPQ